MPRFMSKTSMPFRLPMIVLALAIYSSWGVGAPRIWTTPDGRYTVGFPTTPEEFRLEAQGGAGVGYKALESTPDGPIVYSLTVTVSSQIQHRPPESQIREILTMVADNFLRSVDADPAKTKAYAWSTLGTSGPLLNYEATYIKDGAPILTRGFFVMDDISTVSVSISHSADLPRKRREAASPFLMTLMVRTDQKLLPIGDYVDSVASGAGGRVTTCPAGLVEAARSGISKAGGTLLQMACFAFDGASADVQTKLDTMQNKLSLGNRKGAWKPKTAGSIEQVVSYGKDGISWRVIPASGLAAFGFDGAQTTVMVQMMR